MSAKKYRLVPRKRSAERSAAVRPACGPGRPLPLGATIVEDGVNFAVHAGDAGAVTLVLFPDGPCGEPVEIDLDARSQRTGSVWHIHVPRYGTGLNYAWRTDDRAPLLLDPYARAVAGAEHWREGEGERPRHRTRYGVVVADRFDWQGDRPPGTPLADSVIYELHVRGFSTHPSAELEHPGTYLGLVEMIPYLRGLGVTAVELLPVFEFEELEYAGRNPETGERLCNYWGYQPLSFFAPKVGYAAAGSAAGAVAEFKTMVRELHRAGIEVILDVVFNHTGEGEPDAPPVSWRGLDPTYYLERDFTGCGNTVNANHPLAQDLIMDALRYWVAEMHVDGFRFDLGAALTRGRDGEPLDHAPLLERIAADPLLVRTKLIAEPWDAAGLYRLGSFGVREGEPRRWSEWNDRFRDDLRRFVRGDDGSLAAFATRLAGSSDLFRGHDGAPQHGINYAACHDGMTLADLTAYSKRRNEPNGEGNRDGHGEDWSWNCGVEGPTDDPEVLELRRRQIKNMLALTLCAQGVPLLQAGDELGLGRRGNNNAWCQDNETNWIDWSRTSQDADLLRFVRLLLAFRKQHPGLRRTAFFADGEDPAVRWHGQRPHDPDWSTGSRLLAMQLVGEAGVPDVHLIANSGAQPLICELPEPSGGGGWYSFVDTALPPGEEIVDPPDARPLGHPRRYLAAPRSVVVLVES